jgi:hypothetical protein
MGGQQGIQQALLAAEIVIEGWALVRPASSTISLGPSAS